MMGEEELNRNQLKWFLEASNNMTISLLEDDRMNIGEQPRSAEGLGFRFTLIANYLVWFHQYWAALRSVSTYFLISFSCFSFFLLLMKWILKCHQRIYKQKRKLSLFFLFIKCYIKEKVKRILTDLHEGAKKAPHPFLLFFFFHIIYIYKCINWVRQKSFKPFPTLEIKDLSPAFIS